MGFRTGSKLPSIMAPRFAHFQERSTTLRIDRPGGPGIDLGTVEYLVTFGGAKDDVGAVICGKIERLRRTDCPAS